MTLISDAEVLNMSKETKESLVDSLIGEDLPPMSSIVYDKSFQQDESTERLQEPVAGTLHRLNLFDTMDSTDDQSQTSADYRYMIHELTDEIDSLKFTLQHEQLARQAITAASQQADQTLAKVLADAWQTVKDEKEAHQRTLEELEDYKQEYEYYRGLYDKTEERLYREMTNAKEAMMEVQKVQRQLARVKEENEVILDHLVRTKLEYANKCMEYDELEKKYVEVLRLYHLINHGYYSSSNESPGSQSSDNEAPTESNVDKKERLV